MTVGKIYNEAVVMAIQIQILSWQCWQINRRPTKMREEEKATGKSRGRKQIQGIPISTEITRASVAQRLDCSTSDPQVPSSNPTTDMTFWLSISGHCGTLQDSRTIEPSYQMTLTHYNHTTWDWARESGISVLTQVEGDVWMPCK